MVTFQNLVLNRHDLANRINDFFQWRTIAISNMLLLSFDPSFLQCFVNSRHSFDLQHVYFSEQFEPDNIQTHKEIMNDKKRNNRKKRADNHQALACSVALFMVGLSQH